MEIFLEFMFTISFSFVISFLLAKLLSFSSIIDQHLEIVSRLYAEVKTESEKHEFEEVDALCESVEEIGTQEESSNGGEELIRETEGTVEGISSSEENFVSETTEIELAKEDEEGIEDLVCDKENGGGFFLEGSSSSSDDDDWEGIERTELEKDFGAAVSFLVQKSNADQVLKLGNDLKMQLYGLHKIATQGPCHEPQPMPFKLSARAKWNAWKKLGNMSPEAAMELYITLVSRSIPGWLQPDICGDGKQDYVDAKASSKRPLDVKKMAVNQAIDVDYRTSNMS
ncbi:hypothetical protein ERO13_A12G074800v2 [Gossypium hirsutum]|uniref:Acyl-CoA-binding domain-containing protein 3 n=4 Tax=Gossypium TaxID=3633 RepID=A0ABM2ZAZ9_GOSHI|nr:acyl-CoA-binding domain-containing protein 3-like [Gossypium hirsutum]XP_040939863.1 acyl-CoA-binding domain-containing protein 3-like [Gossypium hirsutum]TYG89232.1 hypothetical protein ES288_A12G083300v1 [Gossypium darwinii]TYH95110.1 hypothetical protein ES332_A12G084500v1 [Gossypium tomentosum]TYJ04243.1 hypothetical protein E1A91_A12G079900v1 [Gossypium mustelinum]KAG4169264.1 hypothetical protein ERO13_A12G074800v2 [Gossypium hirsutum]TYH95111.1 hypothetical protein ES332_A12G084500v